jgi:hypothetical protein
MSMWVMGGHCQFVIMGGSADRMELFASIMAEKLAIPVWLLLCF